MTPRELEILQRLRDIANEAVVLHAELAELREAWERDECPDFSDYSPNTRSLLEAAWSAPGKMLSKADIGEAIAGDDMIDEGYIRLVVFRAKNEMKNQCCQYTFRTVKKEGYKLEPNVTKTLQKRRKPRK